MKKNDASLVNEVEDEAEVVAIPVARKREVDMEVAMAAMEARNNNTATETQKTIVNQLNVEADNNNTYSKKIDFLYTNYIEFLNDIIVFLVYNLSFIDRQTMDEYRYYHDALIKLFKYDEDCGNKTPDNIFHIIELIRKIEPDFERSIKATGSFDQVRMSRFTTQSENIIKYIAILDVMTDTDMKDITEKLKVELYYNGLNDDDAICIKRFIDNLDMINIQKPNLGIDSKQSIFGNIMKKKKTKYRYRY